MKMKETSWEEGSQDKWEKQKKTEIEKKKRVRKKETEKTWDNEMCRKNKKMNE